MKHRILLFTVCICILSGCALGPINLGPIKPTPTISQQQIYALMMNSYLLKLDNWMNGPVAKWHSALDTPFTDQMTYGQFLTMMAQNIQYFNLEGIQQTYKDDPKVYNFFELLKSNRDGLKTITNEGNQITTLLNSVVVPKEVVSQHLIISDCVQFQVDIANEYLEFLDKGKNFSPSFLRDKRCDLYQTARSTLGNYVSSQLP